MPNERTQRKTKTIFITYMRIYKYNKKEWESQMQKTNGYQWGKERGKEQDRDRGLKGTNYCM